MGPFYELRKGHGWILTSIIFQLPIDNLNGSPVEQKWDMDEKLHPADYIDVITYARPYPDDGLINP